jgi:hypothetical protein
MKIPAYAGEGEDPAHGVPTGNAMTCYSKN